jgi:hypothetical protein
MAISIDPTDAVALAATVDAIERAQRFAKAVLDAGAQARWDRTEREEGERLAGIRRLILEVVRPSERQEARLVAAWPGFVAELAGRDVQGEIESGEAS